jgi:hypothetical protein
MLTNDERNNLHLKVFFTKVLLGNGYSSEINDKLLGMKEDAEQLLIQVGVEDETTNEA